MSVNKIHIIGHLGRDPEMAYKGAEGELAVTKVSAAVNRSRGEGTDWFNLVAFGKTAEFLNSYGAKGRKVYVEGRMQQNRWEDADGQTRTAWDLVVEQVEFLDPRAAAGEPEDL